MLDNNSEIPADVLEKFENIIDRLESNADAQATGNFFKVKVAKAECTAIDIFWERFEDYALEASSYKWIPVQLGKSRGQSYVLFELSNIPKVFGKINQLLNGILEATEKQTINNGFYETCSSH